MPFDPALVATANLDLLANTVFGDLTIYWPPRCRPRVLIVTDGSLSYQSAAGFGLSRFVDALSKASPQPFITLAHRNGHPSPVQIPFAGAASYPVLANFNFATAATAVTTANYDQIWMFGFNTSMIASAEAKKIAEFMNAGGGIFSTGDHGTLGQAMGGQLPRVRFMREWALIPMGTEGAPVARDRIDTVVNPGLPNGLYEFDDQGDSIPQRIYPNYKVTWSGSNWTASIHPLLRLPNSPQFRTDASGFTKDMDVMPDHPHESVCYDVSTGPNPAALNGTYNLVGLNFQEFPNASAGGGRIGSEIVAFAVSGGRAVDRRDLGIFKPPVNPRMFGIMSAFDGHSAVPYAGAPTNPGRIVCDSTWHHFVNVNLDGTSIVPPRTGLGTGSGAGFVPSGDLLKIFTYYKNILSWLQPANRIYCWFIYDLVGIRFNAALIEELIEAPKFQSPAQFEGLGMEAMRLIDDARGPGAAAEATEAAIRAEGSAAAIVDADRAGDAETDPCDCGHERRIAYALGKGLAYVAANVQAAQPKDLEKQLAEKQHDKLEKGLSQALCQAAEEAVVIEHDRATRKLRKLAALKDRKRG